MKRKHGDGWFVQAAPRGGAGAIPTPHTHFMFSFELTDKEQERKNNEKRPSSGSFVVERWQGPLITAVT